MTNASAASSALTHHHGRCHITSWPAAHLIRALATLSYSTHVQLLSQATLASHSCSLPSGLCPLHPLTPQIPYPAAPALQPHAIPPPSPTLQPWQGTFAPCRRARSMSALPGPFLPHPTQPYPTLASSKTVGSAAFPQTRGHALHPSTCSKCHALITLVPPYPTLHHPPLLC